MTPLEDIVATLGALPNVEAICLAGSAAAGSGDARSDTDVIVFARGEVDIATRRRLAERYDPEPEINNPYWGPGDYWFAGDAAYDVYVFDPDWFEDEVRNSVTEHLPKEGYSTCFWFTARHMSLLYDRAGWAGRIQRMADVPYPAALRDAIIARNLRPMAAMHTSYRNQIASALRRDDWVSVGHRTTAFLACAFDILFAIAEMPHPGEKRQIAWLTGKIDEALLADLDRAARIGADHLATIDRIAASIAALTTR